MVVELSSGGGGGEEEEDKNLKRDLLFLFRSRFKGFLLLLLVIVY